MKIGSSPQTMHMGPCGMGAPRGPGPTTVGAPENQNYWELAIALSKLRTAGDYPQNRLWNRSMPTLRSVPCWEGMLCKPSFPKRPGKLHHSKKSSLAYCTPYTFRVCMRKDHRWNGSTSLHQTSTKRRVQYILPLVDPCGSPQSRRPNNGLRHGGSCRESHSVLPVCPFR